MQYTQCRRVIARENKKTTTKLDKAYKTIATESKVA